jgi:hypothetical protein
MKSTNHNIVSLVLFSSLALASCGGSQKAAESPSEPAPVANGATTTSAPSESAPSEPAAQPGGEAKTAASATPAAGVAPTTKRSARDVLELKDTVFFLAFDDSDAKKAADASCSKSSGKNAKKMAACMAKAREHADEGHRFEQDKDGNMWWLVVHRKGNALVTDHKVRVTYGTESDKGIAIVPEGKDFGTKPWKKLPSELKFEVPTDYRLVVHDAERGKLVYEAKSGIGSK